MQIEIPGYRIIRTLGKGGMASVYLAIQESFEREVALKVMSPELSKDAAFGERFLREARIVSRLIHPNIVTVYDVGIHEGYYFLSMEYVSGQDLTRKRFDLTLADSLNVVKDIARALDYAGVKGYVHRDVKPENIMLHDESGRAVLMDFGIARPSDTTTSGMTQTGMAIGTPHYMSPEQAKGEAVDTRSDLYSLGIVLFLLLTGRVPFHADSAVVVGIKHVSEDIPRLPTYLQVFQPIIDCVLAKDPLQRYQTGAELIEDLEAIPAAVIAETAAQREREHLSTDNEAAQFSGDNSTSLSYSQAASFFSEQEKAATMFTTKIPVIVSSDDATTADTLGDTDAIAIREKSAAPKLKKAKDAMVASSADRVGRHGSSNSSSKKTGHGGRLFFLVLVLLAVSGFYFQTEIKTWLQPHLTPVIDVISDNTVTDSSSTVAEPNLVQEQTDLAVEPLDSSKDSNETVIESAQSLPDVAPISAEMEEEAATTEDIPAEPARPENTVEELSAVLIDQETEQTLLDKAEAQLASRQLIAPRGDNALETYRELLVSNPGHVRALEGEAAIEKALLQEVQQLMREENFLVATTRLASAREQFPQSQAMLALSLDLDQAVLDNVPRVAHLAVTSTETNSLQPQEAAIAVDRMIYIGFEYRNFKAETSVIQAILFDGSRGHQIVQVPVIVSGANGIQFFRMEQPVAGFAEGGYSIDLLLDDQLLITANFSVKRP